MNQAVANVDQSNRFGDVMETLLDKETELLNANQCIEDLKKECDAVMRKLVDNEIALVNAYRSIEDLEKQCDKKDEQIRKLTSNIEKMKLKN